MSARKSLLLGLVVLPQALRTVVAPLGSVFIALIKNSSIAGFFTVLDIFGFAKRYIEESYYTKSRRCRDCVHDLQCVGVHINFVRAHGYAPLQPVTEESAEQPVNASAG